MPNLEVVPSGRHPLKTVGVIFLLAVGAGVLSAAFKIYVLPLARRVVPGMGAGAPPAQKAA